MRRLPLSFTKHSCVWGGGVVRRHRRMEEQLDLLDQQENGGVRAENLTAVLAFAER